MNEQMVKRREQNRRAKRLSQSEVHLCPMSNTIGLPEVINLRPVMIYSRLRINGHKTPVIIDITCAPRSS